MGKFFMIDDCCYYIGSQNLYIANLAEWGVVVDCEEKTHSILEQYWNPMWKACYESVSHEERDCRIERILVDCGIDRAAVLDQGALDEEQLQHLLLLKKGANVGGSNKSLT